MFGVLMSCIYKFRGYVIKCCGYHQPDHCVWWEATDSNTGEACFHGKTLREVEFMIIESEKDEEISSLKAENSRLRAALKPVLECQTGYFVSCSVAVREAQRIFNESEVK